jgi:hypothetical protein
MKISPLFFGFIISSVAITWMILTSLYSHAGIKWKTKPYIPFALGTLLLIGTFIFDMSAIFHSEQMKDTMERIGTPSIDSNGIGKQFFFDAYKAYDFISKLAEIVLIPTAIALIVVAFSNKIEIEFNKKLQIG